MNVSMVYNWVYVTEATASISDHKNFIKPSEKSEGFFLQHLHFLFVNYYMATIETKELFVVASTFVSVDSDIQNVFTSKEDADTWRTDEKNIDKKYQGSYKTLTFAEWIDLLKEESYSNGRRDGAEMGNDI